MPGVLILEAMAQAGGLLLLQEIPDRDNKLLYLASMNDVKFRRPVVPGDQLRVEVDIVAWKGDLCKIQRESVCGGESDDGSDADVRDGRPQQSRLNRGE